MIGCWSLGLAGSLNLSLMEAYVIIASAKEEIAKMGVAKCIAYF